MKSMLRHLAVVILLIFGVNLFLLGQGLYWESNISGPLLGGKEMSQQNYYMPKMIKQVSVGRGEITIIRLDKQVMYTVNTKDTTYSEMTFAELESSMKQLGGKMDEAMKQMQEQMASMPEEQRKMVEQMMGNKIPGMGKEGKIELASANEKKTISGFSCSRYTMTQDGKEMCNLWVTKDVAYDESAAADIREFSKRMAAMMPKGGKALADGLKEMKGFPIQTEIMGQMTTVVTKIEKKSTPAGEFDVPPGFKKVKSKLMNSDELDHKGKD